MEGHSVSSDRNFEQVEFSGSGGEYFKIWIVNVLLSIITLGIYSAWAKVRTQKYFHGHTTISQTPFNYLATPIQILKGRLIAFALFIVYSAISQFVPEAAVLMLLVLLIAAPWLITQNIRFNLVNVQYGNVRFNFRSSYSDAFVAMVIPWLTIPLTLGLSFPWASKVMNHFIYNRISVADVESVSTPETGSFYKAAFIASLALIGSAVLASLVFGIWADEIVSAAAESGSGSDNEMTDAPPGDGWQLGLFSFGSVALFMVGWMVSASLWQALVRNHLWQVTQFPEVASLRSDVPLGAFAFVQVTNVLAILVTLGFAYPWALVRKSKFLAQHSHVMLLEKADQLRNIDPDEMNAIGEETAGMFDTDFSIV